MKRALPLLLSTIAACATRGQGPLETTRAFLVGAPPSLPAVPIAPAPATRVASRPAADEPAAAPDPCRPLINYLDRVSVRMGMKPKKECRYELVQMMPVQKLDGGYLFTEDPRVDDGAGSGQGVGVAFLRTDKDFPQGSYITGVALYTGSYTYEALDGFPKKVFAFELAK